MSLARGAAALAFLVAAPAIAAPPFPAYEIQVSCDAGTRFGSGFLAKGWDRKNADTVFLVTALHVISNCKGDVRAYPALCERAQVIDDNKKGPNELIYLPAGTSAFVWKQYDVAAIEIAPPQDSLTTGHIVPTKFGVLANSVREVAVHGRSRYDVCPLQTQTVSGSPSLGAEINQLVTRNPDMMRGKDLGKGLDPKSTILIYVGGAGQGTSGGAVTLTDDNTVIGIHDAGTEKSISWAMLPTATQLSFAKAEEMLVGAIDVPVPYLSESFETSDTSNWTVDEETDRLRQRWKERFVFSVALAAEIPLRRPPGSASSWLNASLYIEAKRWSGAAFGIRIASGFVAGSYHTQVFGPVPNAPPLQETDLIHYGGSAELDAQFRFRLFSTIRPSFSLGVRLGGVTVPSIDGIGRDAQFVGGVPLRFRLSFSNWFNAIAVELAAIPELAPNAVFRYTDLKGTVAQDRPFTVTFSLGIAYEH